LVFRSYKLLGAMTIFGFDGYIFLVSLLAGLLGALSGLGGGVVLVPVLVLAFGVDIHYAAGASLVSVIATSTASASAYLRDGFSNVKIAMFLEIATTLGAMFGAYLAGRVDGSVIAVIFGLILIYSALAGLGKHAEHVHADTTTPIARYLGLKGTYPEAFEQKPYAANHAGWGFAMMSVAGALSGLLGVGSGALKVLAMDRIMGLPIKVSTTTSNFMIGVTACASAGVYLRRGYIDPVLSMPVVLGVVIGSLAGARLLPHIRARELRLVFAFVMLVVAVELIYKGLTGAI